MDSTAEHEAHHSDGCNPRSRQVCQKCLTDITDKWWQRGYEDGVRRVWRDLIEIGVEKVTSREVLTRKPPSNISSV